MTILRNFSEQNFRLGKDPEQFDAFIGFRNAETRSLELFKQIGLQSDQILFLQDSAQLATSGFSKKRLSADNVSVKTLQTIEDKGRNCEVEQIVLDWLTQKAATRKILLDISSMPRDVIAAVLQVFEWWSKVSGPLQITIGYCIARYSPPPASTSHNKAVRYVHPRFAGGQMNTGLPVAAIAGLGYEKGKALGAIEYLQSDDWWAFVPESSEKRYLAKVKQQNREFLKMCGENRTLHYQVNQPLMTLFTLESLVAGFQGTYKPVLLPFGPKIFFACALLVALIRSECSVFYVTGEDTEQQRDRVATQDMMGLSFIMELESSEEDFDPVAQNDDASSYI
jgi:hypothetical protein